MNVHLFHLSFQHVQSEIPIHILEPFGECNTPPLLRHKLAQTAQMVAAPATYYLIVKCKT